MKRKLTAAIMDITNPPPERKEDDARLLRTLYGDDLQYYKASAALAIAETRTRFGRISIRMIGHAESSSSSGDTHVGLV